ncbi:hypothetical protein BDV93DRAFT_525477 [Ceratobasidium sp. AG-I]|nr:hypothetical protein BDV93DRAFT_525477 [Ceratobasidium sp. AG-I]
MACTQIAHINVLPSEILSSIFILLVDASLYACSIGDKSYDFYEYPTLISSVCTHWRSVSVGIPYLWSSIDLVPGKGCLKNAEKVKLWLERSQNLPLRLRLGGGRRRKDSTTGGFSPPRHLDKQIGSTIRSCAPRIHSFFLGSSYSDFVTEALWALLPEQNEGHAVRELALRQRSYLSKNDAPTVSQDRWHPLLKPLHVLHLQSCNITFSAIPCQKLVVLRLINPIGQLSLVEFVRLLESNPDLRFVELHGFRLAGVSFPSEVRPIKLLSLRSIRCTMSWEFITWFFKLLIPGPHELDLYLNCAGSPEPDDTSLQDTLIYYFQQTRIKSLYLQAKGVSLSAILASLPHLQSFGLGAFNFSASSFAGLESATNLLPKLHTIGLNECNFDDYSELYPGLRALLSLPSVRQIRHLKCGERGENGTRKRVVQLLKQGGFAAVVTRASAWEFEDRASPFR